MINNMWKAHWYEFSFNNFRKLEVMSQRPDQSFITAAAHLVQLDLWALSVPACQHAMSVFVATSRTRRSSRSSPPRKPGPSSDSDTTRAWRESALFNSLFYARHGEKAHPWAAGLWRSPQQHPSPSKHGSRDNSQFTNETMLLVSRTCQPQHQWKPPHKKCLKFYFFLSKLQNWFQNRSYWTFFIESTRDDDQYRPLALTLGWP